MSWLTENAIVLIPAAPLVACLWIVLCGLVIGRRQAHLPVILALGLSCLSSYVLLLKVVPENFGHTAAHGEAHGDGHAADAPATPSRPVVRQLYSWIDVGGVDVNLTLRADAMTALMLTMVTTVSLLVAIFASSYMNGDPGYPRFFAAMALFVFSMCMLVLSGNFLQMFVFWEAVGLCSYLLIGFWFRKPSAAAAAKKAFVVNRIGDFGLILGVFFIWTTFDSLDFDKVLTAAAMSDKAPHMLTLIGLLLFVGAVGKSAQFPLHVWLPDAMEGPTPVSALIHAATMVTAGVYLVARCAPLYVHAPVALMVVAGIGATTALIAAVTALTQFDLKRVLAYSTVSQLGYMFMALGAAGADPDRLMQPAVTFAMFHMFTHAFFKAVLFLAAGSVMHAMGDVIDMRRFSGLKRALPITHITFLCGSLALAGVPLLSGFWSKDEILAVLWEACQHGESERAVFYALILAVALLTSLMTAFYTFRAYFMTFHGAEKFPPEAGHHPHDASPAMACPLYLLAIAALGVGFILGPTHIYAHYLHHTPHMPEGHPQEMNYVMMAISSVLALGGIWCARYVYVQTPGLPERIKQQAGGFYQLSSQALYLDQIYLALVVNPLRRLAEIAETFDRVVIDAIVDGAGWLAVQAGQLLRPLQGGLVQNYAVGMLLGLMVFVLAMMQALAG